MLAARTAANSWHDYLELEMTVIPIPHGQKYPCFRWKRLQWTKLHVLFDTKHFKNLAALYRLGGEGLAVICGRPSENLFVIDCDTPEALAAVKRQLTMRGINAPCVLSSRGGHLYLRSREGAVKGIASGKIKDIEIKGDGELAVLPPSIHETGHVYKWQQGIPYTIPTISTDDIDFLIDSSGNSVQLRTTAQSQRRLHDDTRRYLERGTHYPVGTRNDGLYKAARDYAYVGKTRHDAYYDLIRIAKDSGLDESEACRTIDSAFKSPSTNPTPGDTITDQLHAFMANVKWEGRTGNTDKRVFAALVQRRKQDAYNRQDGQFRASYREIMSITGIRGWRTIKRSLARFKSVGYLEKSGNDKASGACIYRFSDMVIHAGGYFLVHKVHTNTAVAVRSTSCGHYAHPLSKSIGTTATEILNQLHTSGEQSAKQIASAIGKHRTTITRHLAKLIEYELVNVHNNLYTAKKLDTLEEIDILREIGAYAKEREQHEQFDRDRANFALYPIVKHLFAKNQNKQEASL